MRRWRFAHRAGACCHQELCCKSQDSAGEIGTATWVGMGSENTDVWHRNNSENYTNSARGILGFTSSHRSIASDVFPTFHADIPDGEQPQGKSLQMRHLSSGSPGFWSEPLSNASHCFALDDPEHQPSWRLDIEERRIRVNYSLESKSLHLLLQPHRIIRP